MKNNLPTLLVIAALSLGAFSGPVRAQAPAEIRRGPTSKIFLAETKGVTQIMRGGKLFTPQQATTFDAPGTVIETKADSHDAFVYSNGTGMYVDQNTRVEINRFVQEPFLPPAIQNTAELVEPSISQSYIFVARGAVGICTSRLLSGSTMSYATPQALVNIRHGRVSIQTTVEMTTIDLLEGDVTVRTGDKDLGGQILRAGDRAIVRSGRTGEPAAIAISPTPGEFLRVLDERVTIACNAKKAVTFKAVGPTLAQGQPIPANDAAGADAAGAGQEIVASPTVPLALPTNITISADRLPGGTP